MINCCICHEKHHIQNSFICNNFLTIMLKRYININIKEYSNEIDKYIKDSNGKKYKYNCKYCKKMMSSTTNYRYHMDNNVCKKKNINYKCDKCDKEFVDNRTLKYHINNLVCEKKQLIQNQIINNKTVNYNQPINIQNQTNIANQTNNNFQNNQQIIIAVNNVDDFKKVVELIPFRNASYNISPEKYLEYANNPEQAIKKFIKDQHFNSSKPECMNILNTNARSNRVQIFDKDDDDKCRWMTKDKATINELLYDRGVNHLFVAKDIIEANGLQLDPRKERRLQEKIKEYETDERVKREYIGMIADLTYDYKDIVENNKKIISKLQLQIK